MQPQNISDSGSLCIMLDLASSSWLVKSVEFPLPMIADDLLYAIARRKMFCKLDLCLILGLIILAWAPFDFAYNGQLIRPIYVYEGLIKDMRDYFNNTCILLLHNPNKTGENDVEYYYKHYVDWNDLARWCIRSFVYIKLTLQDSWKANKCWFFRNIWAWLILYALLTWIFICSTHEWALEKRKICPFSAITII